jgi:endo-1,3(4)-beta-glucanase
VRFSFNEDHHFHYGYLLYASAIMASVDPSFVTEYGPYVDAIFHDVAHYSNGDSQVVPKKNLFFPLARHKSWYDGHSFATGMFPFGNGKSQESSSEAVNCYFGAYLWARARRGELVGGSELVDFTRLLLAMEIRGAQTYWHMVPADKETNSSSTSKSSYQPYTPNFRQNYMVGNVGMLDVSANTWFGNDNLYVHMINALPITAITAVLFQSDYVSKEYPFLMGSRSGVEMAWRGYTVSIEAIYDPIKAWKDSQSLVSYELDSAISKSQVLYFIATRPGFNISMATNSSNASHHYHSKEDNDDTESSKANNGGDSDASCSQHDSCAGVGLVGFCCPTGDGKMLGCCD